MQINMKKKAVKQAGSPIFIREIQDFNLDMLTLDPEWNFVVFLRPFKQMADECLRLDHACYIPVFQFMVH